MRCEALPGYLNVTLTPSNPILHTTRLKTLFADYRTGKKYSQIPLFYEEWSDESSKCLFACDGEVQNLCRLLGEFDLTAVRSLKEHYESATPEALTQKIRSIASFRGIQTPYVEVEGGYIPDFNSRYFTADFPYGLAILQQIAAFAGAESSAMEEVYGWYEAIVGPHRKFRFSDYAIFSKAEFIKFYSQ